MKPLALRFGCSHSTYPSRAEGLCWRSTFRRQHPTLRQGRVRSSFPLKFQLPMSLLCTSMTLRPLKMSPLQRTPWGRPTLVTLTRSSRSTLSRTTSCSGMPLKRFPSYWLRHSLDQPNLRVDRPNLRVDQGEIGGVDDHEVPHISLINARVG